MVGRAGEPIDLSWHCTLPDELPMQRIEQVFAGLDDRFKLKRCEVQHVPTTRSRCPMICNKTNRRLERRK
jgi:hypothetical protein